MDKPRRCLVGLRFAEVVFRNDGNILFLTGVQHVPGHPGKNH